jgi:hypothetical protein
MSQQVRRTTNSYWRNPLARPDADEFSYNIQHTAGCRFPGRHSRSFLFNTFTQRQNAVTESHPQSTLQPGIPCFQPYAAVEPYVTKDGSEIRELMHPSTHANHAQSLAEASVFPGERTMVGVCLMQARL